MCGALVLVVALAFVGAFAVARAQSDVEPTDSPAILASLSEATIPAQEAALFREEVFMGLNNHMRQLARQAKSYTEGEPEALVRAIGESALNIPHGFHPETRALPKSEAKAEIWQSEEEFLTLAYALEQAAQDALEMGITQENIPQILSQLGGACQACHTRFRTKR